MTEHHIGEATGETGETGETVVGTPDGSTGHAEVDGVLLALEALPGLPVEEHVAVFEDAHLRLRNALSGS